MGLFILMPFIALYCYITGMVLENLMPNYWSIYFLSLKEQKSQACRKIEKSNTHTISNG